MTTLLCDPRIIRLPEVLRLTGLSRSWIYAARASGHFPSALQLGPRAVGWKTSDVEAWIASRERTNAELARFGTSPPSYRGER